MSRFQAALTLAALALASLFCWRAVNLARARTLTLYLGTYSKDPGGGICSARFDPATGQLSAVRVVAALADPSWIALSRDKSTLYALSEGGDGAVSAFAVEKDGALQKINAQPLADSPAHLGVDKTGKWLATAAYNAGTVTLFAIEPDGKIGAQKQQFQLEGSGPKASRQEKSHAHQAIFSPDNRRLWVADLGSDRVWLYDFDADKGALKPSSPPFVALPPGSGPRHLAFKAKGGFAYVVSELGNTISVFEFASGAPKLVQTISTLPADFQGTSYAAEIAVSADGRFVYASNRGAKGNASDIAVFAVSREGRLSPAGRAATGQAPRHFALDPSGKWLLAANQQDRAVTVYAVDAQTGALLLHSKLEGVPGEPTCLVWGR